MSERSQFLPPPPPTNRVDSRVIRQSRAIVRRTDEVCRRGLLCFAGLFLILGLVFSLALLAPWWGGPVHAQEPTATTMSPPDTPGATEAPTPTASPTETSVPVETATEMPTETVTPTEVPPPLPTDTATPLPTDTPLPTETATPTALPSPTETATATPTATAFPPTPTTTPTTTPTPYQGPPPPEPVMALSLEGAAGWTTPIPVAVTANDSENPAIAVDADGYPHVAWSEKRSDVDWDIYYSRWNGTSWTGPFAVTATTSRSMRPHLAVDGAGLVHIVWEDDRDGQIKIFYSQGNDTSWSLPISLSGTASYPKIGIDSTEKRHVVWDGKDGWDIRYANSTDGVNWTPPQQIPGSSGGYASDMVVDHQDVHVVWIGMSQIHYARRTATGWTTPQAIFTGNCDRPSIAVGSDGQVHVSWLGGPPGGARNDIYYLVGRSGSWSAAENVSNDQKSEWNDIVVDGDNVPHVVWDTWREGPEEIYHAVKDSSGNWVLTNVSRHLSADSRWPKAEGKGDAIHVVWEDYRPGNWDIYYAVRSPAPPTPTPTPTEPCPPVPTVPPARFKGANWLRFIGDPAGGTDYNNPLYNIGWNLERAKDIKDISGLGARIVELRNEETVYTIVRLESPPPDDPFHNIHKSCDDLRHWMDDLDKEYREAVENPIIAVDISTIPVFILGNEPNHFGAGEWNYTAKEYAHLYNCYYQRWRVEKKRPHLLFAAGPAQFGPGGIDRGWWDFLPEMFGLEGITCADGFAMHVYGYYQGGDPTGDTLFKPWLDLIMREIGEHPSCSDRPVIITEYNPGAVPKKVNPPPLGWRDWFDQTYCWVKARGSQIRGLLYFADEQDQYRHETEVSPWWQVSLRSDPDRRTYWLDAPSISCGQVQSSQGQSFQIQQSLPTDVSIGGVISGTLGMWGYYDVYSVTEDLEIPAGQTLTIAPGTSLVFSPGRRMIVAGRLVAEGNAVYPIRFLSTDEAGWEGIHFQPSALGSLCTGCYLENLGTGGAALQVEAPITFQHGFIRDVPGGTAISSTVPFTLSHVVIDYASTGIHVSGESTSPHRATHFTLSRCRQGVVNHGGSLALDNSIIVTSGVALSTEASGTTAVSYTLFYDNGQDFVTEPGAQLIEGPGLFNAPPGFVDYPNNFHLRADSPAVNAADPQADYSQEPGYNGSRADLGAYGNTREAPQQPPLDQMAVTLETDTPLLTGRPGETLTYTLTLKNRGTVPDTYMGVVEGSDYRFITSLYEAGYDAPRFIDLAPQEQISVTVWERIPPTATEGMSNTISVRAIGRYGVRAEVKLRTLVTGAIACQLYPIALSADTVATATEGQELVDILNGAAPGNFGWLTWRGDAGVPALVASLTPPGDSHTYVNPYDPTDHTVSLGDWVAGRPGVANSSQVRQALDNLKPLVITVPVWDQGQGQGNNTRYRVSGYARVQISDYRLAGQNRLSAIYWGMVNCEQ